MTCSAHFNIQSEGVHISALEHCKNIKFSVYVHQTLTNSMLILQHVEKDIIIRVRWVYKKKFKTFLYLTLISKLILCCRS